MGIAERSEGQSCFEQKIRQWRRPIIPALCIANEMRTRNAVSYILPLYLTLLLVIATDRHCAKNDFTLRVYSKDCDKYALKYDSDNPSDPDKKYLTPNPNNPNGDPDIPMDCYHFDWPEIEDDGGDDTTLFAKLYIKRDKILEPHTFVLEFSDRVTQDIVPLTGSEVKDQSRIVGRIESLD